MKKNFLQSGFADTDAVGSGIALTTSEELVGDLTHENAMNTFNVAIAGLGEIQAASKAMDDYNAVAADSGDLTHENAVAMIGAFSKMTDDLGITPDYLANKMGISVLTHENSATNPGECIELTHENAKKVLKDIKKKIVEIFNDALDLIQGKSIEIFQGLTSVESKAAKISTELNETYTDEKIDDAKANISLIAKLLPIMNGASKANLEYILEVTANDSIAKAIKEGLADLNAPSFKDAGHKGAIDLFKEDKNIANVIVVKPNGKKIKALVTDDKGKVSVKSVEVTKIDSIKEGDILSRTDLISVTDKLKAATKGQKDTIKNILAVVADLRKSVSAEEDEEKLKKAAPVASACVSALFSNAMSAGGASKDVMSVVASMVVLYKKKGKEDKKD